MSRMKVCSYMGFHVTNHLGPAASNGENVGSSEHLIDEVREFEDRRGQAVQTMQLAMHGDTYDGPLQTTTQIHPARPHPA
eukprot:3670862-Pyramimonas_sp.AAC.1